MRRVLLLAATILAVVSCKKEPAGLPPDPNWQSGGATQATPSPTTPMPSTPNPHGGMDPANPHGDMDMTNPHGGGDMAGGDPSNPHGMGGGDVVPGKTPPKSLDKTPDGRVVLGPFTLQPPKEWTEKPVTSSMRAASWDMGDQTELVVYYFGNSGAGSVEANLDRWLGQVAQPDGKASKDVAKIEKTKFADQEATIVTVSGHYAASSMMGGPPTDIAQATLIAAIVNSPSGPYYFKFTGTKKTVDANTAKFRAMLASIKVKA
jgi:hypothetical protein